MWKQLLSVFSDCGLCQEAFDEALLMLRASHGMHRDSVAAQTRRATAVTISGTISGWFIRVYLNVSPGYGRVRLVAKAASVAATVASVAATRAINNERMAADCTASLCQAEMNHRVEKPSQTTIESPALKAYTTSVAIGRYNRKKHSMARKVKPGSVLTEKPDLLMSQKIRTL